MLKINIPLSEIYYRQLASETAQLSSIPFSQSKQAFFWFDILSSLKTRFTRILPDLINTGFLMAIAILTSLALQRLHVPVSWLLGAMLAGIGYVSVRGRSQKLFPGLATVGQVIIALATAARFSWDTLTLATSYAVPLLFCIVITGSLSLLNGYLLSRWAGIERRASFLGCIPGAGPSIVALSEEMGADTLIVAVLQYLRILLVSAIIPIIASLFFTNPINFHPVSTIPVAASSGMPMGLNLLILTLCGGIGIWGGRRLKLPSALFLGPFLVGLVGFWSFPNQLQVPQPVLIAGLLLVGLSIGLKFDWQSIRQLLKAVVLESFLVIALLLICLGVAYSFHHITQVDLLTSILGTTPGGISTMIASAMELSGDSGLVMAMQMTRMLLILLITPWLTTVLRSPEAQVSTVKAAVSAR